MSSFRPHPWRPAHLAHPLSRSTGNHPAHCSPSPSPCCTQSRCTPCPSGRSIFRPRSHRPHSESMCTASCRPHPPDLALLEDRARLEGRARPAGLEDLVRLQGLEDLAHRPCRPARPCRPHLQDLVRLARPGRPCSRAAASRRPYRALPSYPPAICKSKCCHRGLPRRNNCMPRRSPSRRAPTPAGTSRHRSST